jgi:hypothetical protein
MKAIRIFTSSRLMKKRLLILMFFLIAQFSFAQQFTDLNGDYLGQTPPSETPVVFAPGVISNNCIVHSAPIFSSDGNEVYWKISNVPNNKIKTYQYRKIWFMQRINNRWTMPKIFNPFNDTIGFSDPFLSKDGKRL